MPGTAFLFNKNKVILLKRDGGVYKMVSQNFNDGLIQHFGILS